MQYLIAQPHAGLGNRIRCLISAERVARLMNRQFGVIWHMDNYHCFCAYHDLFDDGRWLTGPEFLNQSTVTNYRICGRPTVIKTDYSDVIYVNEENFVWHGTDEYYLWGQYGPHDINNEFLKTELLHGFGRLRPNAYINKSVRDFCNNGFSERNIGVHIRREDNKWSNKHCRDQLFIEAIDRELSRGPGVKIFLATDGHASEQKIRARYNKRVISYPVRSLSRGKSVEAIQDAFIIMLILAKTDVIVRSCSSTFSQCSAWIGNKKTVNVGKLENLSVIPR